MFLIFFKITVIKKNCFYISASAVLFVIESYRFKDLFYNFFKVYRYRAETCLCGALLFGKNGFVSFRQCGELQYCSVQMDFCPSD
jgi:hypothetical protein